MLKRHDAGASSVVVENVDVAKLTDAELEPLVDTVLISQIERLICETFTDELGSLYQARGV